MAKIDLKRVENKEGNFFVDSTCIDCDTCRWVAPETFTQINHQSAVYQQPQTEKEQEKALQALLACPTSSIGTVEKPEDILQVQKTFPILIEDNVFYCGYHSQLSFSASSYFIQHSLGNILVDSPRFTPALVKQLEAMGGVQYMYLSHRDDIADHQKYHDHFNCQRILHREEISANIPNVEIELTGKTVFHWTDDLLIIPVPGHTKGHTVLLYRDKFLFSGDHISWSENLQQIVAFRNFCWYSWSELIESTEKLLDYSFQWILPGHGRRYHADSVKMKLELQKSLQWMKQC